MNWQYGVWALCVAGWTVSLLVPLPKVDLPDDHPLMVTKFVVSKVLHVTVYAALAVLTGWLRAPARARLLLLFFLMAHAAVTEHLQTYIPRRTGSARDVCVDHLGVLAGLALSWRWWARGLDRA